MPWRIIYLRVNTHFTHQKSKTFLFNFTDNVSHFPIYLHMIFRNCSASSNTNYMSFLRSQDLDLEQGTSGHVNGEPRNGTNSVSVKFQRDENSGVKNNCIRGLPRLRFCIVIKHLLYIKKVIDPQGPFGNLICLIFCVTAIFLDPLFFYIPVTNDDNKCLRLDKKLGIAASVLRSVFDVFYTIYIIFKLRSDVFASCSLIYKEENSKKIARTHLMHFFLIDLLAILPLPQVRQTLFLQLSNNKLYVLMH